MSLFSGGEEGEGYQFLKQGSQKFLTLPLNTNKKSDPPHFYSVIFFKTLLPLIDSCLTNAQSVTYFF